MPGQSRHHALYNTQRWRHIARHQLMAEPLCAFCAASSGSASCSRCAPTATTRTSRRRNGEAIEPTLVSMAGRQIRGTLPTPRGDHRSHRIDDAFALGAGGNGKKFMTLAL
jgi:hypothetical protein